MEETIEFLRLHNLKVIEYKLPTKELFSNMTVLDGILEEIWETFAELSAKTSLRFQRMKMLNEADQVDLVCAYIVDLPHRSGQSQHRAKAHRSDAHGDRQHS